MVQWPLNIIPRKVDNAMNVILQKILDIETNQIKIDVHRKLIRGNIEHKVFRTTSDIFLFIETFIVRPLRIQITLCTIFNVSDIRLLIK